jgi:hypothetical protein
MSRDEHVGNILYRRNSRTTATLGMKQKITDMLRLHQLLTMTLKHERGQSNPRKPWLKNGSWHKSP